MAGVRSVRRGHEHPRGAVLRERRIVWVLLALGAALRLTHYLTNRSLSLDEAFLALNLMERSLGELGEPLDNNQASPIGFLALANLSSDVVGTSEYGLRLIPLLAGLASLPVFAFLALRLLAPRGAIAAVFLFSVASPLVVYSAVLKQYSTDVLFAVLLSAAALSLLTPPWRWRGVVLLAAVGALSVWFSHPAAFVLGGIGIGLAVAPVREREWRRLAGLVLAAGIWLVSFGFAYRVGRSNVENVQESFGGPERAGGLSDFVPFPPTRLGDAEWFARKTIEVAVEAVGFPRPLVAVALLVLVAGVAWLRTEGSRLLVLTLPIVLALGASGVGLYPFRARFLLFTVPALMLLLAAGIESFWERARRGRDWAPAAVAALATLPFLATAADTLADGGQNQSVLGREMRPLVRHLAARAREGDRLFLAHDAQYSFRYYAERSSGLPWALIPARRSTDQWAPTLEEAPPDLLIGERRPRISDYLADFERLRGGGRTWVVFLGRREAEEFPAFLDRMGLRLDGLSVSDANLLLHDFRGSLSRE